MKITVIGPGRWGSFIAWYLDRSGHEVTLYGREGSKNIEQFIKTRSNGLITLPQSLQVTTSLESLQTAEIIVVSIGSQGLRKLLAGLDPQVVAGKTFVLCMKGLEIGSGKRLSQVAAESLPESCKVAVWIGPGRSFTPAYPTVWSLIATTRQPNSCWYRNFPVT